mgnify:CR=1 FL=1
MHTNDQKKRLAEIEITHAMMMAGERAIRDNIICGHPWESSVPVEEVFRAMAAVSGLVVVPENEG